MSAMAHRGLVFQPEHSLTTVNTESRMRTTGNALGLDLKHKLDENTLKNGKRKGEEEEREEGEKEGDGSRL